MDTTNVATTTGFISTLFAMLGYTAVTPGVLQNCLVVIGVLISIGAHVVAHFSHKSAVAAALDKRAPVEQA